MSLADIINAKKTLDAEKNYALLHRYGEALYKITSYIAEYLIHNFQIVPHSQPVHMNTGIPKDYISIQEFEKKYGIVTANTLGGYCRNQELPFDAYTYDPSNSTEDRYAWYVDPRRVFDYISKKPSFKKRIKRGMYKPELKELLPNHKLLV